MRKRGLVIAVIVVLVSWLSTWIFIPMLYKESASNEVKISAGTFGDMFGGVNALFSGLAFVGLIYTILVQKKELDDQGRAAKKSTEQLNLQMAMSVLQELIKTKKMRYEDVEVKGKSTNGSGNVSGAKAFKTITENAKVSYEDSISLKSYTDLCFYTLSFIDGYNLTIEQKPLLWGFMHIHMLANEVEVLYLAAKGDARKLSLLNSAGFKQEETKPND